MAQQRRENWRNDGHAKSTAGIIGEGEPRRRSPSSIAFMQSLVFPNGIGIGTSQTEGALPIFFCNGSQEAVATRGSMDGVGA